MKDTKPCIHAEVCADGCDLEDIAECGYYQAERTCHLIEDDEGRTACSECGASYLCMSDATWCPDCGARVERDA